jgi:hypothetical protein
MRKEPEIVEIRLLRCRGWLRPEGSGIQFRRFKQYTLTLRVTTQRQAQRIAETWRQSAKQTLEKRVELPLNYTYVAGGSEESRLGQLVLQRMKRSPITRPPTVVFEVLAA